MNFLIYTCVIIITVTFVFLSLELIDALKQIKKTASEIEKLAYNTNRRVEEIEPAFKAVNSVTNTLISGWGKLITFVGTLFNKNDEE